jgi:hypothetical protein
VVFFRKKMVLFFIGFFFLILFSGYVLLNWGVSLILSSIFTSHELETSKQIGENQTPSETVYEIQENKRLKEENFISKIDASIPLNISSEEQIKVLEKLENSLKQESTKMSTIESNNTESKDPVFTYEPNISQKKALEVGESLTNQEKFKIVSTLIGKLSLSEMNIFLKMVGNGMQVEEKKEAKRILLKKLSEEEYNQLIAIASKYGISEGRQYKESWIDVK